MARLHRRNDPKPAKFLEIRQRNSLRVLNPEVLPKGVKVDKAE